MVRKQTTAADLRAEVRRAAHFDTPPQRVRGAIGILILIVLLALVATAAAIQLAQGKDDAAARARRTERALGEAKSALVGAASVGALSTAGRPGDLPCPDLNNDGGADPPCPNPADRVGRLPYKTLNLPDLHDGDGERLWYAVSERFVNNPRYGNRCDSSSEVGSPDCLNSDTPGTITVRDDHGSLRHDGTSVATGVIAVVFSAGAVLRRQGAGTVQDRSCDRGGSPDATCLNSGVCSGTGSGSPPDYFQTARCNPINYLDAVGPSVLTVVGATGSSEDNTDFADSSTANGFIAGPIRDAQGNLVVNDQILAISHDDLMPFLEQRVAREVLNCLSMYSTANSSRFPFAADPSDWTATSDSPSLVFGRVPDPPFDQTDDYLAMSDSWPPGCRLTEQWWTNWKNLVFFAYAANLRPDGPGGSCATTSDCLTANPPSNVPDKTLVVIVSGRGLSGQTRSASASIGNFLEGENSTANTTYMQGKPGSTFNDTVVFK